MSDPIQVWPFAEAPEHLRVLSDHGGDEDWLALVPPHLAGGWIPWCEDDAYKGRDFGCAGVQIVTLPDGYEVRIGAHA